MHGLNFTIEAGSTVGVVGSTGAGKTSLVDIFLGLLKPTGGEIFVDNENVLKMSQTELREFRRKRYELKFELQSEGYWVEEHDFDNLKLHLKGKL